MARPIKEGLDYFSFDCDFYENKKVRKIMRACGPAAGSILSCLLCNIYKWKGYYILWDDDLPFDIADDIGVSEGAVSEVVKKALQVDFFHQGMFDAHSILTSEEIQKRYKSGTVKRSESVIEDVYSIISGRNRVNTGRNRVIDTSNEQSKVKESKVKESKRPPPPQKKEDDWVTKPAEEQIDLALPAIKRGAVVELFGISKGIEVTPGQVESLWKVFKYQNFTGEKFYQSENQVYSHFINWCKTQTVKDIPDQQPAGDTLDEIRRKKNEKIYGG